MNTSRAINADDLVADVLARSPRTARLLFDRGMHCVGCAIAPYETIAEACAIYGVSLDTLLRDLAGALSRPHPGRHSGHGRRPNGHHSA